MNPGEYERMYRLEDTYWWFVGRHRLVEGLIAARYGRPRTQPQPHSLSILDVGCGTGAMSARLLKWGNVVSADFSPLALEFSRRRGLNHLLGADAMRLPLASHRFDLITVMDVLEHLPDDQAALCEFFRVLKPGGRVIATVPAYQHLWSEHDVALMHHRRYTRTQVGERFRSAGFQVEKLSHTMTTLYPIVSLQRRLNARKPPHDPPHAAMPLFPAPVNSLLTGLFALENAVARNVNLPFGVTIMCVAVKPS
jgi:SAM-dependent methyltransferase